MTRAQQRMSKGALRYAVSELQKDVEKELLSFPESEREALRTKFAVFVVHNKRKEKLGKLPADLPCVSLHGSVRMTEHVARCHRYYAAEEIDNLW